MLIVVEGTDCSGKETQSKLLVENLIKEGYKAKYFTFPMYDSPTGKIVGGAYLGKPEIGPSFFKETAPNVDPHIACLYYAADRKYNFDKIQEYLDQDYYVVVDRYVSSNMGHQGGKIKNKDERFNMYQWIDKLEYWLLGLPKADITFFLHMPFQYASILKQNRASQDEHEKSEEHLKAAEEAYLELSQLYNWEYIKCVDNDNIKSIEEINNEIKTKLLQMKNS